MCFGAPRVNQERGTSSKVLSTAREGRGGEGRGGEGRGGEGRGGEGRGGEGRGGEGRGGEGREERGRRMQNEHSETVYPWAGLAHSSTTYLMSVLKYSKVVLR